MSERFSFIGELVETLRTKLCQQAEDLECDVSELAMTFLLTAISDHALAGIQIGDGAMVYGMQDDEALMLVTLPDHGEYLNETAFLSSGGYHDHLHYTYIESRVDRAALLSDGLQMLALDLKGIQPTPYIPFFQPFFEFVRAIEHPTERDQQVGEFLQSERVCARTDDDKTLVIAVREV